MTGLSQDSRTSAIVLARRLSVSVNTVRRRLEQLTANRWLRVRCDVTRAASRNAAALTCWLRVPPAEVPHAAGAIATLPQVRLVTTVTGAEDLVVMA